MERGPRSPAIIAFSTRSCEKLPRGVVSYTPDLELASEPRNAAGFDFSSGRNMLPPNLTRTHGCPPTHHPAGHPPRLLPSPRRREAARHAEAGARRLARRPYLAFVEVVEDLATQPLFPLPLGLRRVVEEFPQGPLLPLQQLTVEQQSERSLCGDRRRGGPGGWAERHGTCSPGQGRWIPRARQRGFPASQEPSATAGRSHRPWQTPSSTAWSHLFRAPGKARPGYLRACARAALLWETRTCRGELEPLFARLPRASFPSLCELALRAEHWPRLLSALPQPASTSLAPFSDLGMAPRCFLTSAVSERPEERSVDGGTFVTGLEPAALFLGEPGADAGPGAQARPWLTLCVEQSGRVA